jgi:hypothetical protein
VNPKKRYRSHRLCDILRRSRSESRIYPTSVRHYGQLFKNIPPVINYMHRSMLYRTVSLIPLNFFYSDQQWTSCGNKFLAIKGLSFFHQLHIKAPCKHSKRHSKLHQSQTVADQHYSAGLKRSSNAIAETHAKRNPSCLVVGFIAFLLIDPTSWNKAVWIREVPLVVQDCPGRSAHIGLMLDRNA